jgi:hypothetical protein
MRSNMEVVLLRYPRFIAPAFITVIAGYTYSWWDRSRQGCYNEEEITLLRRIQTEYNKLPGGARVKLDYFALVQETRWNGWWECWRPAIKFDSELFTLPATEAKDSRMYPLWDYASDMSLRIANSLADQSPIPNNPTTLVYKELIAYFEELAEKKECKKEDRDFLIQRRSHIKKIVHILPDVGHHRLHMHQVQKSLLKAANLITNCMANKELPQLLSDLVGHAKNLEISMGKYLHYLLMGQKVAANYSPAYMNDPDNCKLFPACILHKENESQVQLQFPEFVSEANQQKYIEAHATLVTLIKARNILEQIQTDLPSMGTYMFAVNYLQHIAPFEANYIDLVNRARRLIGDLYDAAENGYSEILHTQRALSQHNQYFVENYRALERIADGTTVDAQMAETSINAIESMNRYQKEMEKLETNYYSGRAAQAIKGKMQTLSQRIEYFNVLSSAMLTGSATTTTPQIADAIPETGRAMLPMPQPVQTSSATRSSDSFISSAVKWVKNLFTTNPSRPSITHINTMQVASCSTAKISDLIHQKTNLIAPPAKTKTEVSKGRSTASSFNQPLTMPDRLIVLAYITHYVSKIMPWNRERDITAQEKCDLQKVQQSLRTLQKNFSAQQNTRAARSDLFTDQFEFVENSLFELEKTIADIFLKNKLTSSIHTDINNKLIRIKEMMHTIADENHQLRLHARKDQRLQRKCEKSGERPTVVLRHNIFTHRVSREV